MENIFFGRSLVGSLVLMSEKMFTDSMVAYQDTQCTSSVAGVPSKQMPSLITLPSNDVLKKGLEGSIPLSVRVFVCLLSRQPSPANQLRSLIFPG